MLYPTVTFNSYEAAVKHIHETPGTWRITKIYRTLPVGEESPEYTSNPYRKENA